MRTPVVAGNWKLNLLRAEAVALVEGLLPLLEGVPGVEVVVCPPFTALDAIGQVLDEAGQALDALDELSRVIEGSSVALGAQNCYLEDHGAYTGEVSAAMLLDTGCTWCIIGHSERRQLFDEADELLNGKLKFARKSGLKVMFCVGETLEEREDGQMEAILEHQVGEGLEGLGEPDFEGLVLAYEPVWAIGTGLNATPDQAEEAHRFIRGLVEAEFGETIANRLRIQYGGSVKPENAAELMKQPNVDGALVGGASLNAESFAAIVKAAGAL